MRFLIIRTFPSILDPNGYNIQEIGFAKALVRAGHVCDVILYNGHNKDHVEEISVDDEHKIKVYLRHGYNIFKNGFFPGLKEIVKDYDILQVHEYDQITSWIYYAFCKDKKVVIYHGPYYDSFNKGYNFKCKVFDNIFLRLKDGKEIPCFTKSNAACDFLKGKGFRNVYPIGVGLDTENFGDDESNKYAEFGNLAADKWNLVYVGKIEPRRNSFLLLEILTKLHYKYPDIHMTVIGNGEKSYTDQWRQQAFELIESGTLTHISNLSQQELRSVYEQADLMLFPSNYEIFGMVLIEAMYFDLPVVSSDNGGSDTLITDGIDGVIVKEFEADKWVNSISELHDDIIKYNSIKKNLKTKDHSVYTWDGIVRHYIEIIKDSFDQHE